MPKNDIRIGQKDRQTLAVNLHQLKKNDFQIANEIREGDNINVSIPVKSFPIRCFNQTGTLQDKLNHGRDEIIVKI